MLGPKPIKKVIDYQPKGCDVPEGWRLGGAPIIRSRWMRSSTPRSWTT